MRAALMLMRRKRGPALQVSPKCLRYGNRSLTSFRLGDLLEVAERTTLGHFVGYKASDREHVAHQLFFFVNERIADRRLE
jgi:hypothetical protein